MEIIWTPLAVDRVTAISQYISKDNPTAAMDWIDSVFSRVEQLKSFPESGSLVPEINRVDVRLLVLGNYRIIYRIGTDQISVLTVRHNRQILSDQELG
ncbi:MAG: type II toxin-antitoxin system RelE/ParE family toxin [Lentisphaeria bacterium]|nr:type II toxin-antitoxin system RelE/ParE family toxin [Candidatus Neomarinimicrobiota bacterium]MCF7842537.1 type II toxin-antitoxin system RelE/ParE family toxin [Lentisphaeria bacterium]